MRRVFTAIIIVSLLMLGARAGICQQSSAVQQSPTEETRQQSQSVQTSNATAARTQPAQLDEKVQKIRRVVEKIGVGGRLTLYLKNGEDLYGSVVRYDAESVQITEIDLKQVVTIQYKNIKKVREDYGKPNLFTGKRSNPPKGVKYGILIGGLVLAFLPIIVVLASKD